MIAAANAPRLIQDCCSMVAPLFSNARKPHRPTIPDVLLNSVRKHHPYMFCAILVGRAAAPRQITIASENPLCRLVDNQRGVHATNQFEEEFVSL
jgi:hypothetical protein